MLSALVTVNANCVSALTHRQGNEFRQLTVIPGVPIVNSELGSSSKSEDVGSGLDAGSPVILPEDVLVFPELTVSEMATMFDPEPSVDPDWLDVVGVTSLIIVSLHALRKKQLIRTISPLVCSLYTRLPLMKYVQLSTFFQKGEATNI